MLEFPIRRYQFTLVAFLLLIAIGWFTFSTIPREEDPSFKLPGFQIAGIMPGADPKDLERLVVKPIEDRLISCAPAFVVMIMITLRKSALRPLLSVSVP